MKKFSGIKLTTALFVCALAPCAHAQTIDATKQRVPLRERRATAATAKSETTRKDETPAKQVAPVEKQEAQIEKPDAPVEKQDAAVENTGATTVTVESLEPVGTGGDAEIESLRARIASTPEGAARARLRQELVERLARAERKQEAVELLRSMLAEQRFDPQFFYNTGNALARLGESESAIEAYRKAAGQRRGNYARAQHNLGVVLIRLGRWEEAEEALTAALKLENYNYAEASYNMGRLHSLRGEAGLAIAEWTRTLHLKADHADAAVALARALAEDGDPDAALAILDSFGARLSRRGASTPREVTVARGEIVAFANVAGERDVAKGSTRSNALRSSSGSATRGRDAMDSSSVVREARRPGVLRPLVVGRQAYDLLRRARAARDADRKEDAVALYRRAIESNDGYFAPANLELGYTLAGLNREEEAVASLLVVIRREGARYPVAFYHLGRFYEHLNQLAQSAEAFARAAELLGDESPQFLIDLSRVREREGKDVEALAAAVRYVQEMEKTGDAPEWARERVAHLQKKMAQSAPSKN
jgi:tetratricopeptide (TPR) repeat protein